MFLYSFDLESSNVSLSVLTPLQPHTLLQRVKSCISDDEEEKLMQITSLHSLNAFLLPIKTVGVQVNTLLHSDDVISQSEAWV